MISIAPTTVPHLRFDRRYRTAPTSAGSEEGACGWLEDHCGLSWQIVPRTMDTLSGTGDADTRERVTDSFPAMRELGNAVLRSAANPAFGKDAGAPR